MSDITSYMTDSVIALTLHNSQLISAPFPTTGPTELYSLNLTDECMQTSPGHTRLTQCSAMSASEVSAASYAVGAATVSTAEPLLKLSAAGDLDTSDPDVRSVLANTVRSGLQITPAGDCYLRGSALPLPSPSAPRTVVFERPPPHILAAAVLAHDDAGTQSVTDDIVSRMQAPELLGHSRGGAPSVPAGAPLRWACAWGVGARDQQGDRRYRTTVDGLGPVSVLLPSGGGPALVSGGPALVSSRRAGRWRHAWVRCRLLDVAAGDGGAKVDTSAEGAAAAPEGVLLLAPRFAMELHLCRDRGGDAPDAVAAAGPPPDEADPAVRATVPVPGPFPLVSRGPLAAFLRARDALADELVYGWPHTRPGPLSRADARAALKELLSARDTASPGSLPPAAPGPGRAALLAAVREVSSAVEAEAAPLASTLGGLASAMVGTNSVDTMLASVQGDLAKAQAVLISAGDDPAAGDAVWRAVSRAHAGVLGLLSNLESFLAAPRLDAALAALEAAQQGPVAEPVLGLLAAALVAAADTYAAYARALAADAPAQEASELRFAADDAGRVATAVRAALARWRFLTPALAHLPAPGGPRDGDVVLPPLPPAPALAPALRLRRPPLAGLSPASDRVPAPATQLADGALRDLAARVPALTARGAAVVIGGMLEGPLRHALTDAASAQRAEQCILACLFHGLGYVASAEGHVTGIADTCRAAVPLRWRMPDADAARAAADTILPTTVTVPGADGGAPRTLLAAWGAGTSVEALVAEHTAAPGLSQRARTRAASVRRALRKHRGAPLSVWANRDLAAVVAGLQRHHDNSWVSAELATVWRSMAARGTLFTLELWAGDTLVAADVCHPVMRAVYVATRYCSDGHRALQPGFLLGLLAQSLLARMGFLLWDLGGVDRTPGMQYKLDLALCEPAERARLRFLQAAAAGPLTQAHGAPVAAEAVSKAVAAGEVGRDAVSGAETVGPCYLPLVGPQLLIPPRDL